MCGDDEDRKLETKQCQNCPTVEDTEMSSLTQSWGGLPVRQFEEIGEMCVLLKGKKKNRLRRWEQIILSFRKLEIDVFKWKVEG